MQIVEVKHRFKNLSPRHQTEMIVIHHSKSHDVPSTTIHQWHLQRGWSGIGYHYVIRTSGTIERGRPENVIGAHAKGVNGRSIGICLTGNFMEHKPTEVQMKSLVELIRDIWGRYGKLKVVGHKDVYPTSCPGKLFPWKQLHSMLEAESKGADDIKLVVNGKKTNVPLKNIFGHTYALLDGHWIQLRSLAQLIHAEIGWDPDTRTVFFTIKEAK